MMRVNCLLASLLALIGLSLTGCTLLPYQASDGVKPGFHDMPLPGGCIVLDYIGNSFATFSMLENAWQQRAQEWCPAGFDTVLKEKDIRRGSIRSPVNGIDTTLGTETRIIYGVIKCHTVQAGLLNEALVSFKRPQASINDPAFMKLATEIWESKGICKPDGQTKSNI
ncbi:hypothetical protein [Shewanella sp. 38A_GOM-205m]|uniref:hypothetical protein n=1 Tax=Shewanella sp. 38A_GOM-205m TaxID=1380363 RepID=UPI0018CC4B9E|nr:hypothetical protein [Shewanella sp. 38A_GOM-205m]